MPRVSVVIPSLGPERSTSLGALRRALASQSLADHELIVISGVSPQGKAINQGAAQARGEILVVLDDDSEIRDPRLLEKLVATLDSDPRIGMAGASVQTPPDANTLQLRLAREFPRFDVPTVTETTDSDQACHGCAAFPLAAFRAVGGEREEIVRGLDPDLRQRLRARGLRVVLAPQAVIFHPLPPTLAGFLRIFVRNGAGSARAQAQNPHLVFETDEALEAHTFVATRPFAYRVLRFPLRIAWALLTLRPFRALAYTVYGFAFLRTWFSIRRERASAARD